MKKKLIILLSLILSLGLLAGCGNSSSSDTLVVGATAKPHAEILEVVKPMLAEEGVNLKIEEFTDYVLINPALNDGQIDANFFQHTQYLDEYNEKNGTDLTVLVKVHSEPMGVYSKSIKNLNDISEGTTIGIPNDATNGGRALLLLEKEGLITLKEDAGLIATDADIVSNPKKIVIQMMDAPMLVRALEDLPVCVINSNYAIEGNLDPVNDAIAKEAADSPYANVLVVRAGDENNEDMLKLAKALQSEEVKTFLEEKYQGACVPAF
ncbi:MAG: MetQ/NlpA family ABC transporter substrate-binding protein [Syntrophomonadaceae bacterium]|nr:MetQ/NlpA family ABC transporter substrate-binding protein [Syntrophomonadaceae bacterium]